MTVLTGAMDATAAKAAGAEEVDGAAMAVVAAAAGEWEWASGAGAARENSAWLGC
jgi:hypothetical protein